MTTNLPNYFPNHISGQITNNTQNQVDGHHEDLFADVFPSKTLPSNFNHTPANIAIETIPIAKFQQSAKPQKTSQNSSQTPLQTIRQTPRLVPSVLGFDDFLESNLPSKTLLRQLNWLLTQTKTEYLDLALALNSHTSVAVKRKVAEVAGKLSTQADLQTLNNWQQTESDRKTWLAIETAIDRVSRRNTESILKTNLEPKLILNSENGQVVENQKNPNFANQPKIITVSEALILVKKLLGEKTYSIEGEVADIKIFYNFFYFALKENLETRLDCRLLAIKTSYLGFTLNEGLSIRATGKFSLSKYSKLTFEITNIQLSGQGELLRNLQMLEKKLEADGLFDPARKRKPTLFPTSVLLIASPHSAAKTDFEKVFRARNLSANVYFLPIKTQGVGAEFGFLQALARVPFLVQKLGIQTIIITRGGGSKDDLQLFNNEQVVRAIFALPAPSIVAIGHEQDHTLSEKVADLRASTPSNSAELCTLSSTELKLKVVFTFNKIRHNCIYRLEKTSAQIEQKINYRKQKLLQKIYDIQTVLYRYNRVKDQFNNFIRSQIEQKITQIINQKTIQSLQKLDKIKSKNYQFETALALKKQSLLASLENQKNSVITQTNFSQNQLLLRISSIQDQSQQILQKIIATSPAQILSKGYAMVSQNGKRKRRIADISNNQTVILEMVDSQIELKKLV